MNVKNQNKTNQIDVIGSLPFIGVHAACVLVFWAGVSWPALLLCAAMVYVRLFGITGGYHRYFSHRSFKTSRAFQFVLAVLGNASAQMGPLWWAAHHRWHHKYSDTEQDIQSPRLQGFFWSHVGWIMNPANAPTDESAVRDLVKYPELRFINRYHYLVPTLLAITLFGAGYGIHSLYPQTNVTGLQFLAWGFFVSTVLLYHITFSINSLAHLMGKRRYATKDDSRNSFFLGLLILGEGWHNNHHRYPASERQGFYWWEIDITHYVLVILSKLGLVWDLKKPPETVLAVQPAQVRS